MALITPVERLSQTTVDRERDHYCPVRKGEERPIKLHTWRRRESTLYRLQQTRTH